MAAAAITSPSPSQSSQFYDENGSYFQMGEGTYRVSYSLYQENRTKLIARFKGAPARSVIALEGGRTPLRYPSSDNEPLFRQESYFHYLFGVREPDCWGLIDADTGKSILLIPRLEPVYAVWLGKIQPPEHFRKIYSVDEVHFTDELESLLAGGLFGGSPAGRIFLLHGTNSDTGEEVPPPKLPNHAKFAETVDVDRLFDELGECRVIKTKAELDLMRYVNRQACRAHLAVLTSAKPSMKEYQLESVFLHTAYFHGGCRNPSYTCICASGDNSAVLHYGHAGAPNDRTLQDGDICLFDMGIEYHCYGSDITTSYPANGRFTPDQREVYTAVYEAQQAAMHAMRPGVAWPEVHRIAVRTILENLLKYGFLQLPAGSTLDDIEAAHMGAVFMPHGLGHMLGIDTHDPAGYPRGGPSRPTEPGARKLRTARVLQEGMVITVEPGVYFIASLLDEALANPNQAKFLNAQKIEKFRGFGGVRLEDDVIITANGIENMTNLPRKIEDIEQVMAGKREWKLE